MNVFDTNDLYGSFERMMGKPEFPDFLKPAIEKQMKIWKAMEIQLEISTLQVQLALKTAEYDQLMKEVTEG